MLKKSLFSVALIGVVALAIASSGGGDSRKAASVATPGITKLKATPGFTLRAGRSYSSALSLSNKTNTRFVLSNTVLTYRKGNTIYIMPGLGKQQKPAENRNNLNMVNLKLKLRK